MAKALSRSIDLRQLLLLVVLLLLYVAWPASFIARSGIETSTGHYFCLFDDAMVAPP